MSTKYPITKTYHKITQKTAYRTVSKTGEEVIIIHFPFSMATVTQVKTLSGRKYNPTKKHWTCPLSMEALQTLKQWGYILDEELLQILTKKQQKKEVGAKIAQREISVPGLRKTLFPFQQAGVGFIEAQDGNALIADEMGLGKTVQALAWLQLHPELRPAIVVCPASLKLNWAKEALAWMKSPKVQVISGTGSVPITGEIIIINYDILPQWEERLRELSVKVLIMDECHYFKNNQAKRTRAVMALGKRSPHKIALSGTPIENRPIEIYNAIRLISPALFPNRWKFAEKFCDLKNTGFGWDFNGASNTDELHQLLSESIMIRRLKKDVLQDLPDKIYSFKPFELTNQTEYLEAENNFISYIEETKGKEAAEKVQGAEVLTQIETLKQLAVHGKMKQCVDWIQDFIESDEKLVLMANHKFVIDALMEKFKHVAVKVDGSVSAGNRQQAVEEFQHNPRVRLFIGNIKAAGVGLTLTAASNVAFMELPWTPGALSQAEDRVHRIGQKNAVTVHYLLASNTIEEEIAKMLDDKRKVVEGVLDGRVVNEASLLTELIKKYSQTK